MFKINDIVLFEDTNDEFNGRAGRVFEQTYEGITPVKVVVPETGGTVDEYAETDKLSLIELDTTTLLIEKCCSFCMRLNWDNKTGGYGEKHLNADTGLEVLCDDLGKLYVDGDLIPPAVV